MSPFLLLRTNVCIAASQTGLRQDAHSLTIRAVRRPRVNGVSVSFTEHTLPH